MVESAITAIFPKTRTSSRLRTLSRVSEDRSLEIVCGQAVPDGEAAAIGPVVMESERS